MKIIESTPDSSVSLTPLPLPDFSDTYVHKPYFQSAIAIIRKLCAQHKGSAYVTDNPCSKINTAVSLLIGYNDIYRQLTKAHLHLTL